jgi:hypothetical protein
MGTLYKKFKMKNDFVVYTALFGGYDNLIDPNGKCEGCDFICFTDQKHLKSDIWEIRIIEECDLPSNMMNRKYKILPHLFLRNYKWSLYIDANVAILNNPLELANKYLDKYDITVPKHFARDCLYEEAKECVVHCKTKYDETKKQMSSYREEGFPEHFGLGENNVIFRKHNNKKVVKIMTDWWEELNTQTKRDQLSFAYVLWKNGEKFCFMDENARGGKFFVLRLHASDKKNALIGSIFNLKNEHIVNFPNGKLKKINDFIKNKLLKFANSTHKCNTYAF